MARTDQFEEWELVEISLGLEKRGIHYRSYSDGAEPESLIKLRDEFHNALTLLRALRQPPRCNCCGK